MQQPSGDTATRLGVVEARLGSLFEIVENFGRKLDARSSINWAPVNIMIAVVTVVGGMFFTWVNSNNARIEAAISKQEMRAEQFVSRLDIDKRFENGAQRRDDLQRLTDARIERAERDVDKLAGVVVPRGEHKEQWDSQRARDEGLQRQIDELRKGQSDLNTPRDTIQRILQRLDALDRAPARRD